MGDRVYVKPTQSRFTTTFDIELVTGIIGPQSVPVDDVPRHVKDLHPYFGSNISSSEDEASECEGEEIIFVAQNGDSASDNEKDGVLEEMDEHDASSSRLA